MEHKKCDQVLYADYKYRKRNHVSFAQDKYTVIYLHSCVIIPAPTDHTVIFRRTPEPSTFPGPPSKPSLSDITETSMRLTWRTNPNHGASPVFAYTVEYFSHETGEVRGGHQLAEMSWSRNDIQELALLDVNILDPFPLRYYIRLLCIH